MSNPREKWLQWACGAAVRVLAECMMGGKRSKKIAGGDPEPVDGRPRVDDGDVLFVAWWRGSQLRCSAWGRDLSELVVRSSEGDAQHESLLPKEIEKLAVSVGIIRRGEARSADAPKVELLAKHLRFVGVSETGVLSDDEDEERGASSEPQAGHVVAMCRAELGGGSGEEEAGATAATATAKSGGGSRSWLRWLLGALLVAALLYMRYNDATYDVEWEVFYSNFAVLGLPEGASLHEVKRAYHKLSLTEHPDKLGERCDAACQERFQRVTDAYQAIRDMHSGRLRIVGKPTRFDKQH